MLIKQIGFYSFKKVSGTENYILDFNASYL